MIRSLTSMSRFHVTLPVAGEINARLPRHRQMRNALRLIAIGHAAIVFAPGSLLRVAEKVRSRDVMMVAEFGTAQAAEIAFRPIRVFA